MSSTDGRDESAPKALLLDFGGVISITLFERPGESEANIGLPSGPGPPYPHPAALRAATFSLREKGTRLMRVLPSFPFRGEGVALKARRMRAPRPLSVQAAMTTLPK